MDRDDSFCKRVLTINCRKSDASAVAWNEFTYVMFLFVAK